MTFLVIGDSAAVRPVAVDPRPGDEGRVRAIHSTARRQALLSDSEATLRQVQGVLADFGPVRTPDAPPGSTHRDVPRRPAGLIDLVDVLMTTHSEIVSIIDSLRWSRGVLEQTATEALESTDGMLVEVSSLQDRTARRLGHAGAVLLEVEDRLVEVARIFDLDVAGLRAALGRLLPARGAPEPRREAGAGPASAGAEGSGAGEPGVPPSDFDLQAALGRVGGDPVILAEITATFIEQWPELRERIVAARKNGDGDAMTLLAHRIKGGAGAVAAARMQALAGRCEARWGAGDLDAASDEILALDRGVEAFAGAVSKALGGEAAA